MRLAPDDEVGGGCSLRIRCWRARRRAVGKGKWVWNEVISFCNTPCGSPYLGPPLGFHHPHRPSALFESLPTSLDGGSSKLCGSYCSRCNCPKYKHFSRYNILARKQLTNVFEALCVGGIRVVRKEGSGGWRQQTTLFVVDGHIRPLPSAKSNFEHKF